MDELAFVAPASERPQKKSLIGSNDVCLRLLFVIIASAVTSFSGLHDPLPLDAHEVYVARTAEEMIARNSWIVPYFNDEPRLRKPPLAYWLAALIDRLGNNNGRVGEVEARVTSAVSGILLCIAVFFLGRRLFDEDVGLVAALLAAASGGQVTYAHSARPELLYACLCSWALVGFCTAICRADAGESAWRIARPAWFGWLMIGAAFLAKGPILPVLLLIGLVIGLIATGRWRSTGPSVRPLSGLLIALVVAGWWYVAVFITFPNAPEVWLGETVQRYVGWDSTWDAISNYLDPYYIYRTAGLVLPWLVLYPFALLQPWIRDMKSDSHARLLWWTLIVPLVLLHLSDGRRWYYMLPAMGPLVVIMAAVAMMWCRSAVSVGRRRIAVAVVAAHIVLLAAALVWMLLREPDSTRPPTFTVVMVLIAALGAVAVVMRWFTRPRTHSAMLLYPVLTVGLVFFAAASFNGSLWRANRFERKDFSMAVDARVPDGAALVGWQEDWEVEQYYGHRTIPSFTNEIDLIADLRRRNEAYVLLEEESAETLDLPDDMTVAIVLAHEEPDEKEGILLWRVVTARR